MATPSSVAAPSIEGTYRLVRRELPDGTVQRPPEVNGTMTYTKTIRNFSVVWKDDKGRHYSECYVARYRLTEGEYEETSEYLIVSDEIWGSGVSYNLSAHTAKSAVSVKDGKLRFALPQPFEEGGTLEFEGDQFKAEAKDMFVDYWEKVG